MRGREDLEGWLFSVSLFRRLRHRRLPDRGGEPVRPQRRKLLCSGLYLLSHLWNDARGKAMDGAGNADGAWFRSLRFG